MRTRRQAKPRTIRASDLAKMAACEQKLVYEKRYGERLTTLQQDRIRNGNHGHRRFLREAFVLNPGVRSSENKPWCFIATELWGEHAQETQLLRSFRDLVLRRCALGRAITRTYYRMSPAVAAYLARRPRARRLVKVALAPTIAFARCVLRNAR